MQRLEFDCLHCGLKVFKRQEEFDHDHCPECLWSLHTNFSNITDEPCFELMRPTRCTDDTLWPDAHVPMMWEYCLKCQYICLQPEPYISTPKQMEALTDQRDIATADWLDPFAEGKGAAIWLMEQRVVDKTRRLRWYRKVLRDDTYAGEPFTSREQYAFDLRKAGAP